MALAHCAEVGSALERLLGDCGLRLEWVADGEEIPGSYWGAPEAGLIDNRLLVRRDTPVHSALHEACHYLCMPEERRSAGVHTDAGGDYAEENGVCYLQILLGALLPGLSRERLCADMDEWGYTFRLGSASAWFAGDAEDARQWLIDHALLNPDGSLALPVAQRYGPGGGAPAELATG